MERYPLIEKIMRLTRILFMAAMMVACTTQSLPTWAQSADSNTVFTKQRDVLAKLTVQTRSENGPTVSRLPILMMDQKV